MGSLRKARRPNTPRISCEARLNNDGTRSAPTYKWTALRQLHPVDRPRRDPARRDLAYSPSRTPTVAIPSRAASMKPGVPTCAPLSVHMNATRSRAANSPRVSFFLQLIPMQARRGVRATRKLALHDSSLLGRARQHQRGVMRRPTDLTRVAAFPSYCATRRLGASKRHASSSRVRRSVTCTFERRTRTVG